MRRLQRQSDDGLFRRRSGNGRALRIAGRVKSGTADCAVAQTELLTGAGGCDRLPANVVFANATLTGGIRVFCVELSFAWTAWARADPGTEDVRSGIQMGGGFE